MFAGCCCCCFLTKTNCFKFTVDWTFRFIVVLSHFGLSFSVKGVNIYNFHPLCGLKHLDELAILHARRETWLTPQRKFKIKTKSNCHNLWPNITLFSGGKRWCFHRHLNMSTLKSIFFKNTHNTMIKLFTPVFSGWSRLLKISLNSGIRNLKVVYMYMTFLTQGK